MYQMFIFIGCIVGLGGVFIIFQELNKRESENKIEQPYSKYRNYMVLEDGTILFPKLEEVDPKGQEIDIVIN